MRTNYLPQHKPVCTPGRTNRHSYSAVPPPPPKRWFCPDKSNVAIILGDDMLRTPLISDRYVLGGAKGVRSGTGPGPDPTAGNTSAAR